MEEARAKRKKTLWLLLTLTLLGIVLVVLGYWTFGTGLPGLGDFYLHRSKYESIVAKARALPLQPGAQTQTRLDGLLVDIGRNPTGSYTVTITTVDWHHAGVYGYVFSDDSLDPHPHANYPNSQSIDNPGNMPFAGSPYTSLSNNGIIGQAGHWWPVYNDLD